IALMTCWPGTASGRVGIRSWSLAKAMFEPQKETEPTIAVAFGAINIVGGFMVTDRMLGMFSRKPKPKGEGDGK
ncbi:MAG TPA: proton-translocating transhydrogenase family protein, partial [Solirubrobacterales bacterium]|nr:proton-translocating transhydrogenase family protein [Solirubrobacterales bacterium]